ncbi:MAG TPA: DoxX family membrane protein [Patescibacteria group bacterium]|nr:DoxX family membrane protein [Patescibacteria group bacterium]
MTYKKFLLLLLRLGLGWLMFYAGWSKLMAPTAFSAASYLNHASTFAGFYHALASARTLKVVDFLNVWGQIAIGVSLILGLWVKWSARAAALLMLLYYFPVLNFPHLTSDSSSYIVDEHIIYGLGFLLLSAFNAGRIFGLDSMRKRTY